jgi:hypothetical protein
LSRYKVSGCNQSALHTDMYYVGEKFPDGCTAKTSLTRACWVDLNQSATGAFNVVRHLQSNVNSDGIPKWLGFALHRKTRIPLMAFALQGDGLNLAGYGAAQLDLDFPYPLHPKMLFQKFIAIPMARESDAVVPSCGFESWESRLLSLLHSVEECLERFLHKL